MITAQNHFRDAAGIVVPVDDPVLLPSQHETLIHAASQLCLLAKPDKKNPRPIRVGSDDTRVWVRIDTVEESGFNYKSTWEYSGTDEEIRPLQHFVATCLVQKQFPIDQRYLKTSLVLLCGIPVPDRAKLLVHLGRPLEELGRAIHMHVSGLGTFYEELESQTLWIDLK